MAWPCSLLAWLLSAVLAPFFLSGPTCSVRTHARYARKFVGVLAHKQIISTIVNEHNTEHTASLGVVAFASPHRTYNSRHATACFLVLVLCWARVSFLLSPRLQ